MKRAVARAGAVMAVAVLLGPNAPAPLTAAASYELAPTRLPLPEGIDRA